MITAVYVLCSVQTLVIVALLSLVGRNQKERKDLLDRIMARDYNEYTFAAKPPVSQGMIPQRNPFKEAVSRETRRQQDDDIDQE